MSRSIDAVRLIEPSVVERMPQLFAPKHRTDETYSTPSGTIRNNTTTLVHPSATILPGPLLNLQPVRGQVPMAIALPTIWGQILLPPCIPLEVLDKVRSALDSFMPKQRQIEGRVDKRRKARRHNSDRDGGRDKDRLHFVPARRRDTMSDDDLQG